MMTRHNGQTDFPIFNQVGSYIKQVNSEMADVDTRMRQLVEQRPLAALLSAIAAGFVLARLAARVS